MAIDSATSLLFAIGANTDDAEANISRFRQLFATSLSDMTGQFSSFASELTGGGEAINASFTALTAVAAGAAVAVGGALFEMARKTAETGEQFLLLSQQIGVSVRELSGLKVVADQMGISFDTLSRGVAIMDRALSPFASSGATAAKALSAIGVSATDASGQLRPNIDLIASIADKFQDMDDGANKTALAMSIFGRSGAEMIPILNRGGQAIRQAAAEGEKFGLVMDKDAAEKSAKFEEATRNLSMTFQGLVQEIGLKVIPILSEGLNKAVDDTMAVIQRFSAALPDIEADLKLLIGVIALYSAGTAAAAAQTIAWGSVLTALRAPMLAYEALLAGITAETAAATAGISVAVVAMIDLVHEYNKVLDAQRAVAEAQQQGVTAERELEHSTAVLGLAIERVTGQIVTGATAEERARNEMDLYRKATAAQRAEIDRLIQAKKQAKQANQDEADSLSTLAAAYQNTKAQIESLQDAQAKPEAAAEAQYRRGLATAQKQLDAYEKQIAAGKQTGETLAQYEAEYLRQKEALHELYELRLDQLRAQEAAKEKAHLDALALKQAAAFDRAQAAAKKMWEAEGTAALKSIDQQDKELLKQIEAQHALETSVEGAAQKLQAMADKSSVASLSAGAKIRAEYEKQIESIRQLVAAEEKKGLTEEQTARLAQAASRAQDAAYSQEQEALRKLQAQQLQTELTSVNSFLHMGIAAAGYRGAVVSALMDVIKTLEKEMLAHITSAAGTATAENTKNAAVGQGVGLRSVWHAAEQFALGLADAASFNFAGAAAHFAASASFTAVAASVGTAVAGLFAGGGSSGGGRGSTRAASATSAAGSKSKGAAASSGAAAPVINIHIDGVISSDNLATVLDQASGLVKNGAATLTASHMILGGAVVATG